MWSGHAVRQKIKKVVIFLRGKVWYTFILITMIMGDKEHETEEDLEI